MIDLDMTDEWGGIDPKIKDLVRILNDFGIRTTGSCEGHADHGSPAPWVALRVAGKPKDGEADEKYKEWSAQHEELRKGIKSLLDEFYKKRNTPADSHLILDEEGGGFRLHSGGNAYRKWREEVERRVVKIARGGNPTEFINAAEEKERAQKLPEYQKEVEAFVMFLKEKIRRQEN